MTFYLKYRPQTLEELDLTSVRETLTQIVKSGNIPHALLFAGPKGTGKTSAARILAKVINCEKPGKDGTPCTKCDQCMSIAKGENLDVIEIDAASHRGIDDIRTLRDAVKLAPAKANKKIYIIDEAHMLTTEASNALLKTLEEPPGHVVFVLATTNPEKLLATIRSRTTIVNFKNANTDEVVRSLARVAQGEKLKLKKAALELIATAARGSLRDSHKILEQLSSEGKLGSVDVIAQALTSGGASGVDDLLAALRDKDVKKALADIEKAAEGGVEMEDYTQNLLVRLHQALMAEVGVGGEPLSGFGKKDIVDLMELLNVSYGQLRSAAIPQAPLEIAVVKWCGVKPGDDNSGDRIEDDKKEDFKNGQSKSKTSSASNMPSGLEAANEDGLANGEDSEKGKAATLPGQMGAIEDDTWRKILSAIRPKNTSIEALLRAAKPLGYDGKTLTLGVYYKFHKERLEESHHRTVVEEVSAQILGVPTRISCTLTEPPVKKAIQEDRPTAVDLEPEVVLTDSEDDDIINVAKEIFEN